MNALHGLFLAVLILPVGQPQPTPQTIDERFTRLIELKKQIADLTKTKLALEADIASAIKELLDKARNNGIPFEPPAPPGPPTPPVPVDPLAAKLKAAFDADPADPAARRNSAKDLAALYRAAAKLCGDASIESSADLMDQVTKAAKKMVGETALRGVRLIVNTGLNDLLPFEAPLSAEQRQATAALFVKVSGILEGF
jgi:hypothetical protein